MNSRVVFSSFYDSYAPKLWGLILLANLPVAQAEDILVNTLCKGWKAFTEQSLTERQTFSILINLARQEGLPTDCLKDIIKPKL